MKSNAEVDYVDADTGEVLEAVPFYDPGHDETSWYAIEMKARGKWRGPHMAFGCGRSKG